MVAASGAYALVAALVQLALGFAFAIAVQAQFAPQTRAIAALELPREGPPTGRILALCPEALIEVVDLDPWSALEALKEESAPEKGAADSPAVDSASSFSAIGSISSIRIRVASSD